MGRSYKVMVILFAAAVVGACAPPPMTVAPATRTATAPEVTPKQGGTLRYGLTLPVSGIDPHVHASSELGIALSSVYDTLVVQSSDGTFHPSLAKSWTISPDGRAYTFELREDVVFHDGTPFDAAAVVHNLDRITDPNTHSQKAVYLLGPFERAEATDENHVTLYLSEPFAPLLDGLSQVYLGMASPAALDRWGQDYQLHQVGTGPFRFVSYSERQQLIIERNADYNWAPLIRGHQGPPYLDRVEFRFYPDPATRLPGLLSGQADVMGELPPSDAAGLAEREAEAKYQLMPVAIPGQSVQFFMNTSMPPMDDLLIRQAVIRATDRQALVMAVFGPTSPVASGPLAAITRGAVTELGSMYPPDTESARQLLSTAGWADANGDGILDKDGKPLSLRAVLMSWGELPAVGTVLQAQLRAAGLDLRLDPMAYPAALEAGRTGTHELAPFVYSGTDPSLLGIFFHSRNIGNFNWARVSDSEVDAWLDQASQVADWGEREALYAKVQRRVMEEAWILPIRDQVNLNAASERVQGLAYDVQGWFPVLYDVWLTSE